MAQQWKLSNTGKVKIKVKGQTNPIKIWSNAILIKSILVKLVFFIHIASQLKGFLEAFQTDKLMVPFLEGSLADIFHMLMKMIIKGGLSGRINWQFLSA